MHANYREINPPPDKNPEDYTPAERRAELFDAIERAGHYRNLQRSYRQLGEQYGVSKQQIRKDIVRILEWKEEHLSPHAKVELETLKTKAVQELLDRGEVAKAYRIMSKHYENLQSMGEEDAEPTRHELDHSGSLFDLPPEVTDNWERTDGDDE
jgi:hypothetical protein